MKTGPDGGGINLTAMRAATIAAVVLTAAMPVRAHQLDEYLQATTISVGQDRVYAQMRLTPGVAVFPAVFAGMDADGDGVFSKAEQRDYANKTLGDTALTVDGERLKLHLVSYRFAPVVEMKEGRGEVQIEFDAPLSRRAGSRSLVFENHHQSRIAVYLVNCLVPTDPNIQVTGQKRNYGQSRYELDFAQTGVPANPAIADGQAGTTARRYRRVAWSSGGIVVLLCAPLAWLLRRRAKANGNKEEQEENEPLLGTASPKDRIL